MVILLDDAKAVRLFSYGVTRIGDNWRLAPALMAEHSQRSFEEE